MTGVDDIIGGWVRDAEKSGEVKKLPGYGKPLELDEDTQIPPKYRMAYRVLKNAGYTPPEVEMIQRISKLRDAINGETDELKRKPLEAELRDTQHKLDVALDKFKQRL